MIENKKINNIIWIIIVNETYSKDKIQYKNKRVLR